MEPARRPGATGNPPVVPAGPYALPGAQDTDTLLGILRQVWDETHPTVLVAGNDAALCGPTVVCDPDGHMVVCDPDGHMVVCGLDSHTVVSGPDGYAVPASHT
ncbi:hypothetical protein [Nonomuraea fuscirosea]|uniref:hypothetical protein n=1 Tax=Nonomuraea fuscirosea TaxID=1291556 RepID=UPI0034394437